MPTTKHSMDGPLYRDCGTSVPYAFDGGERPQMEHEAAERPILEECPRGEDE